MTVRTFLDLSTAHLSPDARAWLSESATANHAANYHGVGHGAPLGCVGATLCGWFFSAPPVDGPDFCDHGIPEDLYPVIRHARQMECFYILADADGEIIDGLAIYDEENADV